MNRAVFAADRVIRLGQKLRLDRTAVGSGGFGSGGLDG